MAVRVRRLVIRMLVRKDGQPFKLTIGEEVQQILADADINQASSAFLQHPTTLIPARQHRTVCALQGEQALIRFHADEEVFIGSVDATTCVIAVLLDRATLSAWTAHYDEPQSTSSKGFLEAIGRMQKPALYLLGGFDEPSGISQTVCENLLRMAHTQTPQAIELQLACISSANTIHRPQGPRPACYNLAVSCSTSTAMPAGFEDRGPELPRRFAFHQFGSPAAQPELLRVTSDCGRRLSLPGFSALLPALYLRYYEHMIDVDDQTFLQGNSTSPDCEPDTFVDDVKGAYRWILSVQRSPRQPTLTFSWDASLHQWVNAPPAVTDPPSELRSNDYAKVMA